MISNAVRFSRSKPAVFATAVKPSRIFFVAAARNVRLFPPGSQAEARGSSRFHSRRRSRRVFRGQVLPRPSVGALHATDECRFAARFTFPRAVCAAYAVRFVRETRLKPRPSFRTERVGSNRALVDEPVALVVSLLPFDETCRSRPFEERGASCANACRSMASDEPRLAPRPAYASGVGSGPSTVSARFRAAANRAVVFPFRRQPAEPVCLSDRRRRRQVSKTARRDGVSRRPWRRGRRFFAKRRVERFGEGRQSLPDMELIVLSYLWALRNWRKPCVYGGFPNS